MRTAIDIIKEAAFLAGVTPDVLRSKQYVQRLFGARMKVYRLLREERKMSFPQIASFMGGRNHSTIFYALTPRRPERLNAMRLKGVEKGKTSLVDRSAS
jgi:chromosomal replication initiation ATPase DnaA